MFIQSTYYRFDIQTRALLLVNINTCSISIDKYIYQFKCIICNTEVNLTQIAHHKTKYLKITDGSGADPGFQVREEAHL